MKKEFVMRGSTPSGTQEVLNFSGNKEGYAYRMVEFNIYPSTGIGTVVAELAATVTAAKTFEDPENPNYNNEGLIGTSLFTMGIHAAESNSNAFPQFYSVVNDTFLITQNLILAAVDTFPGSPMAVNWQCRFVSVKMSGSEEAAVNYKQFTISDD